ncbi:tripartite tricarboxylate transporter permease, partial [Chloroflexota bacterium]
FGHTYLRIGVEVIPALIGILALSELLGGARQSFSWPRVKVKLSQILPTSWKEVNEFRTGTIVGTIVGLLAGALPGAGPAIAAFISYQQTKIFSKQKKLFGKGSPDLLAACDSAQNAAVGGALVPTLALGVPGSGPMVLLLAVLQLHGVLPGPDIWQSYPPAIYAAAGGLMAATILLFPIGLALVRPIMTIMTLSRPIVVVSALVICMVAVYTFRWASFDVYVLIATGLLGYIMRRFGYPVAPAALALLLGGMLERNLRLGLVICYQSWALFLLRPAVIVILLMAVGSLLWPYVSGRLARRREMTAAVQGSSS